MKIPELEHVRNSQETSVAGAGRHGEMEAEDEGLPRAYGGLFRPL